MAPTDHKGGELDQLRLFQLEVVRRLDEAGIPYGDGMDYRERFSMFVEKHNAMAERLRLTELDKPSAANGHLPEPVAEAPKEVSEVTESAKPEIKAGQYVRCTRDYLNNLKRGQVYKVRILASGGKHLHLEVNAYPIDWFEVVDDGESTAELPPQVTELNA